MYSNNVSYFPINILFKTGEKYQEGQEKTKCCAKTGLKLVFFQYFTNETAYWEIIYNCPIKLKLSQRRSRKGWRDL